MVRNRIDSHEMYVRLRCVFVSVSLFVYMCVCVCTKYGVAGLFFFFFFWGGVFAAAYHGPFFFLAVSISIELLPDPVRWDNQRPPFSQTPRDFPLSNRAYLTLHLFFQNPSLLA